MAEQLAVEVNVKNLASEDTTGNISGKFCCIGVTLGIALHQEFIASVIALHQELHFIRNCIASEIALHQ